MFKKVSSCLVLCLSLTACGINEPVEPMTYTYNTSNKPANQRLINQIRVSDVSDRRFKEALEQSLQNTSLNNKNSDAHYVLNAKIDRFESPSTIAIHYRLIDSVTNSAIYSKTIDSSYSAAVKDSFAGAARENIRLLIEDLYKL